MLVAKCTRILWVQWPTDCIGNKYSSMLKVAVVQVESLGARVFREERDTAERRCIAAAKSRENAKLKASELTRNGRVSIMSRNGRVSIMSELSLCTFCGDASAFFKPKWQLTELVKLCKEHGLKTDLVSICFVAVILCSPPGGLFLECARSPVC